MRCLTLFFVAVAYFSPGDTSTTKIVSCFYRGLAAHRANGKVEIGDVNYNLCSHVVYSALDLNPDGSVQELSALRDFADIKKTNPKAKLHVSIGGSDYSAGVFSSIAGNALQMELFLSSVLTIAGKYGIDGFDIMWLHAGTKGPERLVRREKANFASFLKNLRETLNGNKLTLSVSVSPLKHGKPVPYDVAAITKNADLVNLMTYDVHGDWDGITGHSAPLTVSSNESGGSTSVESLVKSWIDAGGSSEKLLLGLSFYGRTFTLKDTIDTTVGASTIGPGIEGPITHEPGLLSYVEVCQDLKSGWKTEWDNDAQAPYASKGNQWISYDDVKSIEKKTELVDKFKLGGVFVWSVDSDDVFDKCHDGDHPLLTVVSDKIYFNVTLSTTPHLEETATPPTTIEDNKDKFGGADEPATTSTEDPDLVMNKDMPEESYTFTDDFSDSTSTAESTTNPDPLKVNNNFEGKPTTRAGIATATGSTSSLKDTPTTTETTTVQDSDTDEDKTSCDKDGILPDPDTCSKFYRCVSGTKYSFDCTPGTLFDVSIGSCNRAELVHCFLPQRGNTTTPVTKAA